MTHAEQHPRLWLAYFWLSVVTSVGLSVYGFLHSGSFILEAIGLVSSLVALVPLYGYVRQRAYHPRLLWSIIFYLSVLAAAALLLFGALALSRGGSVQAVVLMALALAFMYPYLFAVNEYISRSPHLWQTRT